VSLMVLKLLMAACVLVVVAPQWGAVAQSNGAAGLPFARRDDMPDKPRQLRTGRTSEKSLGKPVTGPAGAMASGPPPSAKDLDDRERSKVKPRRAAGPPLPAPTRGRASAAKAAVAPAPMPNPTDPIE